MKPQTNKAQSACDVKIYADKGSLALRFPLRHNAFWEALDGKSLKGKPKCLGIGKYGFSADEPDDWKRATQIAISIEADLDDPEWDKLFDRTLAKYGLGGGKYAKLADIMQIPGTSQTEPEITVGVMWESYLEWKKPQLQPTTFNLLYQITYTNPIKGLVYDKKKGIYLASPNSLWDERLSKGLGDKLSELVCCNTTKRAIVSALSEAFLQLQQAGKTKLAINPFSGINSVTTVNKTDKYKSLTNGDGDSSIRWWDSEDTESDLNERDRRAFTKEERDIIIKAFYESDRQNARQAAPLIEFLFLTGCRSGEAFAIEWKDVFLGWEKNCIRFSKSYNARLKNIQVPKTGETRIFKSYPKLDNLLLKIKPENANPTDLIFIQQNGNSWGVGQVGKLWNTYELNHPNKKYTYPGIVTELVNHGAISCYLSPYHTRHTFITLMAQAGANLLLLATACGNSVEVIQRHYLSVDMSVSFPDI
jgi:integrase